MKWRKGTKVLNICLPALFKALDNPACLYILCSFKQSNAFSAEAVRFVKLALLWTLPTFFTSRETTGTTGTGRLPDLIKLKDIQTDRLGEASDPLRFNLFGSITAG